MNMQQSIAELVHIALRYEIISNRDSLTLLHDLWQYCRISSPPPVLEPVPVSEQRGLLWLWDTLERSVVELVDEIVCCLHKEFTIPKIESYNYLWHRILPSSTYLQHKFSRYAQTNPTLAITWLYTFWCNFGYAKSSQPNTILSGSTTLVTLALFDSHYHLTFDHKARYPYQLSLEPVHRLKSCLLEETFSHAVLLADMLDDYYVAIDPNILCSHKKRRSFTSYRLPPAYRAGRARFPLQDAMLNKDIKSLQICGVSIGVVCWPMPVLRLLASDADALLLVLTQVERCWREALRFLHQPSLALPSCHRYLLVSKVDNIFELHLILWYPQANCNLQSILPVQSDTTATGANMLLFLLLGDLPEASPSEVERYLVALQKINYQQFPPDGSYDWLAFFQFLALNLAHLEAEPS
jgi:galactose-1-phosphate uridylyltransferase